MKFVETIKIRDGAICDLERHALRFAETSEKFFGVKNALLPDFKKLIPVRGGLFKARIVYGEKIERVEVLPYEFKRLNSLKLLEAEPFAYAYKSLERNRFEALYAQRGTCDEIIISINGRVCDTSYSNLAFFDGKRFWTPSTYLLNGTKRRKLLEKGKIFEREIKAADIKNFESVHLINAMIDIEDGVSVPVSEVF